MKFLFTVFLFILIPFHLHSQTQEELHELSLNYFNEGQKEFAIELLNESKIAGDLSVENYILLSNFLNVTGNPLKAVEILNSALVLYPNDGRLYNEAGKIKFFGQDFERAIGFWEDGIIASPAYDMNYFDAAKIYSRSNEPIWAVIYSEIFLNISDDVKLRADASRFFFDSHTKAINIVSDSVIRISFSQNAYFREGVFTTETFESFYENIFLYALGGLGDTLDLRTLIKARVKFIEIWFQVAGDKFSNPLFNYQKKLHEEGLLEAYNYFLIKDLYTTEFEQWRKNFETVFNDLEKFILDNPLPVKEGISFNRFSLN